MRTCTQHPTVCVLSMCLTTIIVVYFFQPVSLRVDRYVASNEAPCPLFPGSGIFSVRSLSVTALASFPGSGNSWTRHLLTTATGILTGAVYYDEVRSVFATKRLTRRLLVVKTHYTPQHTLQKIPLEKGVLVIRNPYEALLAEFNREGKHNSSKDDPHHSQKRIRPPEDFKTAWPNYLKSRHTKWGTFNMAWVTSKVPLHVLVYHRLQSNLELELRQVLTFLNQSHSPLVHCALGASEGYARRKKEDWQAKAANFTAEQKRRLNEDIDRVQEALERKTGQSFADFYEWKRE